MIKTRWANFNMQPKAGHNRIGVIPLIVSMERFRALVFSIFLLLASVLALDAQDVVITDVSSTPVSCASGSDGTITVTVSGGVGQYSYLLVLNAFPLEWAGPDSADTFTFTDHPKSNGY